MTAIYNPWLVVLSVVIAVVASFTALSLGRRVSASQGRAASYWLAGGAFAMGSGIWSMHFVGMLAFHLPIPLAYDPILTLLSVVPALLASGLALQVIRRGRHSIGTLVVSAVLMGAGISTMHYTGMAAMRMFPPIRYDPALFTLSVLIAVAASMAALEIAFRLRRATGSREDALKKAGSALLMGAAIAGMHYTGMAAAEFSPNSLCLASPRGIDPDWLAVLVGAGSLSVLGLTLVASVFDARLADQNARIVAQLRLTNERLHAQARGIAESMTAELHESVRKNRLLATIARQSSDAVISKDLEGRITSWNPAAERMFGYSEAEILGQRTRDVCLLMEDSAYADTKTRILAGESGVFEALARNRSGAPFPIALSTAPLLDEDGRHIGEVSIVRDVSEQKRAEERLRQAAAVFENTSEGAVIADARGRVVAVNRAFTAITGYAEGEVIGGETGLLDPSLHDRKLVDGMWRALAQTGHWRGELTDRRKNGETYPKWLNVSVVHDGSGAVSHYVGVFSDITLLKESEKKLHHIAHHDPLTDLPNRLLFEDRLAHAISRARREESAVALLFLDLDRFKNINDTLGHTVGDRLLQQVAWRLRATVRAEDTVARLGGDEFTVILESVQDKSQAGLVAEKLIGVLADPFRFAEHELFIGTSIGISLFPDDGDDVQTLLRHSDAAMYRAKDEGRNRLSFYSAELSAESFERFELEAGLRRGLERDELEVYYQPIVSLRDGGIIGAEALVRWNHPERGMIMPAKFIPIAEESGLIGALEEWVLEASCIQARGWIHGGLGELCISVNLSSGQISHGDIAERVQRTLRAAGLPAHLLQLEITETSIMQQTESSVVNLQALERLGVSLAIDDFGTGYSSMAYLKRFAVQKLKIDRSFVRDIAHDPNDKAIVGAVIAMGHSLGLTVVAEGVETVAQRDFLVQQGCDEMQGFIFSPPVPASRFLELLRAQRTAGRG